MIGNMSTLLIGLFDPGDDTIKVYVLIVVILGYCGTALFLSISYCYIEKNNNVIIKQRAMSNILNEVKKLTNYKYSNRHIHQMIYYMNQINTLKLKQ